MCNRNSYKTLYITIETNFLPFCFSRMNAFTMICYFLYCRPAAAAFLSDVAGTPNFSGHMQIDVINGKVSKFIAILVSVLRKVKLL